MCLLCACLGMHLLMLRKTKCDCYGKINPLDERFAINDRTLMPLKSTLTNIYSIILMPVALLFLVACNQNDINKDLLVSAAPSDFEDVLLIEGVAESVRSTVISCPEDIEAEIVFLVDNGTWVDSGQVVCQLESKDMSSNYESLLLSLEGFEAALVKSRANMEMEYALMEAQVKSLDAQTAIANLDSLQLAYVSPKERRLKELEMERATIERNKLNKKLKALETINQSQLRKQELQIQRWTNRVQSAKDKLDELTLKANQSGLAVWSDSWLTGEKIKIGDQAWSGMPLIMIPDLKHMKVKMEATETQFKQLNMNDSIEFTFDAMPGKKAWGRITSMTPIGRPISRTSKVKVFDIEASIDSATTLPEPGLSVDCRIFLKRVPNVIVLPQLALFDVDSLKVVYVKKGKHYEQRQVITGTTSPKLAVIVAGLTGKEDVSLIKPPSNRVKHLVRRPDSLVKKYSAPIQSTPMSMFDRMQEGKPLSQGGSVETMDAGSSDNSIIIVIE
jgi:HlyD family secretion protein